MPDFKINETIQEGIIRSIREEREKQDQKWGEQNHADGKWTQILLEEVGEVAKGFLEQHDLRKIEEELVQVAAVAVAWLESLERLKEEEQKEEPFEMGDEYDDKCPCCEDDWSIDL